MVPIFHKKKKKLISLGICSGIYLTHFVSGREKMTPLLLGPEDYKEPETAGKEGREMEGKGERSETDASQLS